MKKLYVLFFLAIPFGLHPAAAEKDEDKLHMLYELVPDFDEKDEKVLRQLQSTITNPRQYKRVVFGQNNSLFLIDSNEDNEQQTDESGKPKMSLLRKKKANLSFHLDVNEGVLVIDLVKKPGEAQKDYQNRVSSVFSNFEELLEKQQKSAQIQNGRLMIQVYNNHVALLTKK